HPLAVAPAPDGVDLLRVVALVLPHRAHPAQPVAAELYVHLRAVGQVRELDPRGGPAGGYRTRRRNMLGEHVRSPVPRDRGVVLIPSDVDAARTVAGNRAGSIPRPDHHPAA